MPSSVWNWFRKVPGRPDFAECTYKSTEDSEECKSVLSCKGGSTSGLMRHLKSHNIKPDSVCSSSSKSIPVQTSINFPKRQQKQTLGEILARSAAVDGTSLNAILNSEFVKFYVTHHGYSMPKSTETVKKEILQFYESAAQEYKTTFQDQLKAKKKFSITTDEWSNMLTLQRFINVTVHTETDYFKLGLKVSFLN